MDYDCCCVTVEPENSVVRFWLVEGSRKIIISVFSQIIILNFCLKLTKKRTLPKLTHLVVMWKNIELMCKESKLVLEW